jgi:hypothetical protein
VFICADVSDETGCQSEAVAISASSLDDTTPTFLNMTICNGECSGDCKTYVTPLSKCYNSQTLFPNDPAWSGKDVMDTVICQTLTRKIFEDSTNGSCRAGDQDDHFLIPLDECVGPFGPPRPWGLFTLIRVEKIDDRIDV